MDLTYYTLGIIIIIVGLLMWGQPRLINIFSQQEKEKMNLAGVGKLARNIFVVAGILQLVATFFLQKAGVPKMSSVVFLFLVFISLLIFAAKAEKYKNKK